MNTDCTNRKDLIQESHGLTACGVCTYNSLSLTSNHNSHLNNRFNPFLYTDNSSLFTNSGCLLPNYDSLLPNYDSLLPSSDSLLPNNDSLLLDYDNWNCYKLDNRRYKELSGTKLKDTLKYFNKKDSYQSNYETITVVGK